MQKTARRHSDVAVVGAGITGLSVAWHLTQRGASVVIADREGIAAGATGVQPGGVRQQWSTPVNCELARESVAFYTNIAATLAPRATPRLEPCGYLFVADTDKELARLEAAVAVQNAVGVPSEIVTPERAADLIPGLRVDQMLGASFCREDGYFDKPQAVAEGFAASAKEEGVKLVRRHVVELTQHGNVWELVCADGDALRAEQVVVAAGYDSPNIVSTLGVELPIAKEPRYLFLSDPVKERLLEPLVVASERSFAAKQLADGRVLASDLSAAGDPDQRRADWRRRVEEGIDSLVPILKFVSFPLLVSGFYDVTPDHQPILGRIPGWDGLWIAAGFSGHGFMLAPAVGRRLADAIVNGKDSAVPDDFAYARFDGTMLVAEKQVV